MTRYRWKLGRRLLLMCLAFGLVACGGAAGTTTTGGTSDPGEADTSTTTAGGGEASGQIIVHDGGGAWGEAQRIAFHEPFEEETGIEVIALPEPGISTVQTGIEAGDPGIDVYSLADNRIASWLEADYFEPIDFSIWPDDGRLENFIPYEVTDVGVPYNIYAIQLVYDPEAVDPMDSWADLWDTEQFPGARTLGDGAAVSGGLYEMALLADGVTPDELYPLDIERAFEKLDEIRSEVASFWVEGAEPIQAVIDGQAVAGSAFNGRIVAANEEGANLGFTWNQALTAVHYYIIPKGAPNAENAQKFLEFVSRPEQQAIFSSNIAYAPGNQEAYEFISSEQAALLPTAPEVVDQVVLTDPTFWNSPAPSGEPWNEAIIDMWQEWLAEG